MHLQTIEFCTKLQYNAVMDREPILNSERVRDEMAKQGLKMPALASKIGFAYETLYKAVNEESRRVSAEMVARLAKVFGCSIEYLMGLTDDRTAEYSELGETLEELTQVAKRLTNRRQRDLLSLALAFLQASEELKSNSNLLMDNMIDLINEAGGTVSRDQLIDLLDFDADDTSDLFGDDGIGGLLDDGEKPPNCKG